MTPPGTSWEKFRAAMREVHRTGGVHPGEAAPDVSLPAAAAAGIEPGASVRGPCPRCDHPHAGPPGPVCVLAEAHLGRSPQRRRPDLELDAVSAPRPAAPAGAIAATAMHESFLDMIAGGFTEDQALTFMAKAFAARQEGEPGG